MCVCPVSSKKKDVDLAVALGRAKDLEAQLHQSEAALNTALSQNHAMAAELSDLKAELAKVSILHSHTYIFIARFTRPVQGTRAMEGVTKKSQNIKQTVLFSSCFPAFRGKSQVKVMLGL